MLVCIYIIWSKNFRDFLIKSFLSLVDSNLLSSFSTPFSIQNVKNQSLIFVTNSPSKTCGSPLVDIGSNKIPV